MQLGKILKDDQSYSFSSYFDEMSDEAEDIFAEFGFRLERVNLEFPRSHEGLDLMLPALDRRIRRMLP